MESVRDFLTRLKKHQDDNYDDCDQTCMNGPSIGIAPGQVKEEVHYMEYRGSIDLSGLRFSAEEPKELNYNHFEEEKLPAIVNNNNDHDSYHFLGSEASIVDIVVFEVPERCTSENCDLSKFGVGSLQYLNNGGSYLKLCNEDGRLDLDYRIFEGHHTHLVIPPEGKMPSRIKQRQYNKFSMSESRQYEVMLANCHPNARKIRVRGQVLFDLKDDDVTNLTRKSLSILISVACVVFWVFTILTVRVNMGTQADFEQAHYGLVPDSDDDGEEAPESPSSSGNNSTSSSQQDEEVDRFEDEGQVEDRGNQLRMTQATIV